MDDYCDECGKLWDECSCVYDDDLYDDGCFEVGEPWWEYDEDEEEDEG
jgi:hypothetical protein